MGAETSDQRDVVQDNPTHLGSATMRNGIVLVELR